MTKILRCFAWLLIFLTASLAFPQQGDKSGEVQLSLVPEEKIPPAPPLSPPDALKTFRLKLGFKIELVAAEPLVEEPVAMAFGPDGRLWVVEMRGYMPNPDGLGEKGIPGRVVCLEDTNRDGQMDKRAVFLDGLVMPRALALVRGGVLVAEPPYVWFCRDTDGDGVSDQKVEVTSDYGSQANPELNANGLLWAMDNWIYSANHTTRYRNVDGEWQQEPTSSRGQWGICQDDFGRLFFNSNSDQLRADLVPTHYVGGKPGAKMPGLNFRVAADQSTFPIRVNPGVNRGYQEGTLRADGTLAKFTAACAPLIYRGGNFPAEFQGNAFVCEPAANFVRRNVLTEIDGVITGRNAYPDSEFLASTDERFRPVNLYDGPDGALYIVDMYHGILQHRIYLTTYLRKQIESRNLDKPLHQGRIYRVVHDSKRPVAWPNLGAEPAVELVRYLNHTNGWWRDTAQRLLVDRADASVIRSLKEMAASGASELGRLHALWTLDGLNQVNRATLSTALIDPHPKIRVAALRLAETILATNSWQTVGLQLDASKLADDPVPEVQTQLALTFGHIKAADSVNTLTQLQSTATSPLVKEAIAFSLARKAPAPVVTKTVVKSAPLSPAEQKQFDQGKSIYEITCLACHQAHGLGHEGLAPPLVDSEWVGWPEGRLIRAILHGLRGPIQVKGETYEMDMPSLGVLDDEQIASVLSYVRREWGHNYSFVSPSAVKKVREVTADRIDAWTSDELKQIP